jgi:hypothetical protein
MIFSYNTAIEEANIAQDHLWLAGALVGKASAKVMLNKLNDPENIEFDPEIYDILDQSHSEFAKTKMTHLEAELSLIFAKYLSDFPLHRNKLMELIVYMTNNDLKRLRK